MRIAVQMNGAPRTLRQSYRSLKQQILDHYDCDIYFATLGNEDELDWVKDLLQPAGFIALPYNDETLKQCGAKYLIDKYSNKTVWSYNHTFNLVRQKSVIVAMYTKWLCNELRMKISSSYDVVISTRTDLVYGEPLAIEWLEAAKDHLMIPIGWDWHGGINDLFAMGSPEIMNSFCGQYNNYIKYMENGCCTHPETLLKHHIIYQKLPLKRFYYTFYLGPREIMTTWKDQY
jgi:hypothetical protein